MNLAVFARTEMLEHLTIYRAIFHEAAFNGISLPFFSNFI